MTTVVTSLHPTPESLAAFVSNLPDQTPVTMLNLLRFRNLSAYKPGAPGAEFPLKPDVKLMRFILDMLCRYSKALAASRSGWVTRIAP